MTNKTAATRYARALLDISVKERGDLQRVERDLADFVQVITQHAPLEKALFNPAIPAPRKHATVTELTRRMGISPIVGRLVALLAERDRLVLLPELLATFRERLLDCQQIVRVEVTTAGALPADCTQAIQRGLAQLAGRTVKMAANVDPSIIGGVIARVGSTVYDGSISTQLQKMKQRLVEGV